MRRHATFPGAARVALLAALTLGAALPASGPDDEESARPVRRPNIIFIFADDWGYGDLGCHGSPDFKTPEIDRMAREGTDFQSFTVSGPVCSPSRTAVMTGQFPARHSVHRHFATVEHHRKAGMPDWLDPRAPMLPRMLRRAGYVTGHFGKWHLTNRHVTDAPLPPAYGYDEYGAFNVPGEQIRTAETCPRAVGFIRRHHAKPFFLNVWLHETHTPHYPQPSFLERFAHLDEQRRVYAAVVAEGDAGVGSILAVVRELEIDDRTLVIFSSDNGPESTGPAARRRIGDISTGAGLGTYYSVGTTGGLKGRKRSLYAGGVRTPFIARWPGVVPAGRVDRTSVITAVDLLPTLLEVAGVDPPAPYRPDGESILRALSGEPFERSRPIYWEWRASRRSEHYWPRLGVRRGRWKLLHNEDLGRTELYDLTADWAERRSVAADHPEVTAELLALVRAWKKSLPGSPPGHCLSRTRASSAAGSR